MSNKTQIRIALASHVAYGQPNHRQRVKELLKLTTRELWEAFENHKKICSICSRGDGMAELSESIKCPACGSTRINVSIIKASGKKHFECLDCGETRTRR